MDMATKKTVGKEEQIGYHKGAIATLVKEREELVKLVNVVSSLIQMHLEGLQKLGVDLTKAKPKKK